MQTSHHQPTPDGLLATAVLRDLLISETFSARSGEKRTIKFRTAAEPHKVYRFRFAMGVGKTNTIARLLVAMLTPEARFRALAQKWREKSLNMSSIAAMAMLPEYQHIIGMGNVAVPLILRDLQENADDPDHWHWALSAITGANPVLNEEMGNTRKMADAWLRWAADGNIR